MAEPFSFHYKSGRDELTTTFTVESGQMVMSGDWIWPVVLSPSQVAVVGAFVDLIAKGETAITMPESDS